MLIRQMIEAARNNLETATQLLRDMGGIDSISAPGTSSSAIEYKSHNVAAVQRTPQGAVIIEGVFDGQNMVGPDGKLYSVPANYASKSKLVEGDLLKLTISPDGSFIYKQIGPVERDRIVGVLSRDDQTEDFRVLARGQYFRILLASITYFKADMGDEVVILVPKGTPSSWAAVENVIKKNMASAAETPGMATDSESSVVSEDSVPKRPKRTYTKRAQANTAPVQAETSADESASTGVSDAAPAMLPMPEPTSEVVEVAEPQALEI